MENSAPLLLAFGYKMSRTFRFRHKYAKRIGKSHNVHEYVFREGRRHVFVDSYGGCVNTELFAYVMKTIVHKYLHIDKCNYDYASTTEYPHAHTSNHRSCLDGAIRQTPGLVRVYRVSSSMLAFPPHTLDSDAIALMLGLPGRSYRPKSWGTYHEDHWPTSRTGRNRRRRHHMITHQIFRDMLPRECIPVWPDDDPLLDCDYI